jgi:hypothetical protein
MMTHDASMPAQGRDLVVNLRLASNDTSGPPTLTPEQIGLARDYLEWLLLEPLTGLKPHIELLEKLYQARFHVPLPRRMRVPGVPTPPPAGGGFPYTELLPEKQALAVLEWGVAALPADVLARLLLNPYALWDFADLIDTALPDYWIDRLEERGLQLLGESAVQEEARFAADVLGEGRTGEEEGKLVAGLAERTKGPHLKPKEIGSGTWLIEFVADVAQEMRRRIAARAFGDPDKVFELLLHRVPGGGPEFAAELEMKPAPTANDVSLPVTLPGGHVRTFVLAVPESMKRRNKPRPSTRSNPCKPLPAEAFAFRSSEWRSDGDWVCLVFRSVYLVVRWPPINLLDPKHAALTERDERTQHGRPHHS